MRSLLSTTLCALLAGSVSVSATAIYSITDLGGFHIGSAAQATGINEIGIVVGGDFFSPNATAFRWNGSLHALPALPGQFSASAEGINNAGLIVGSSVSNGTPHAVIWQNDVPTQLPVFGTRNTALDINDRGDVIGSARVGNNDRAFYLEAGAASAIDLGTLGGLTAVAMDVNNAGIVSGYAESANRNNRAFRWKDTNGNHVSDPGEMILLSDLGLSSSANSTNNQGVSGGFVLRTNFTRQAALWDIVGNRINLPNFPGATDAEVFDVNSSLQAVGQSDAAVIWQNNSVQRLIDLIPANSGWTSLEMAFDINDRGQIVGFGRRGDVYDRAFLLTPIPVPEPTGLLLVGTFLLAGCARVRREAQP